MIGIISSKKDAASSNMAEHLLGKEGFEESTIKDESCWKKGDVALLLLESSLIESDIDRFGFEVAYFLSKHKSADQVPALTTHSLGNWGKEAKIGGKPEELTVAAPVEMLGILQRINRIGAEIQKTYEATHHGPLLKTPSFFVELGGDDKTVQNKALAQMLADVVYDAVISKEDVEYGKIAIGIGSTHYPSKFNRLAIDGKYAFSHIMPKYAILNLDGTNNLGVLEQALSRSKNIPEIAVIDWKSINADTKNKVGRELARLGLNYEKV